MKEQDDESLLEVQFQQWLSHPTTALMLRALNKHKEDFINLVSESSMDDKLSDAFVRLKTTGIRNTDAIIKLITNKEAMQKKANKS